MNVRGVGVALVALTASLLVPQAAAAQAPIGLEVVFLEAGHGDTALYRGSCGDVGVIDVNRGAADDVLARLDAWGARDRVAWVSVSHYDTDHVGGVVEVLDATSAEVVYDRGGGREAKDTITYRAYFDRVTDPAGGVTRAPQDIGGSWSLCGTTFTVVSAGTDGTAAGGVRVSDENDRSLCLHVRYVQFDLATCGDAGQAVETAAAPSIGQVEVAKVSHHGSAGSSSPTWISVLDPRVVVYNVGANGYGHPAPAVVSRWNAQGAARFQTGNGDGTRRDGDVTIRATADGSFTVAGQAGRTYSSGSTPPPPPAPGPQPQATTPAGPSAPPRPVAPSASTTRSEPVSLAAACDGAPSRRFRDVDPGNVHAAGIDCIGWWGVTQGVGSRRYDPSGEVGRDQMASFLWRTLRASGYRGASNPPDAFRDDDGSTHEPAIDQLAANGGITLGCSPGRYCPADTVTRAQMATFLDRTYAAVTGDLLPAGQDAFTDDDGSPHEDAIDRVAAAGITGGTSAGHFSPRDPVTRAQMGTFLARLLSRLAHDGALDAPPAAPVPLPGSMADGTFANCDEARRAGAAPVHRGDPGYHPRLDRDRDGIGCE